MVLKLFLCLSVSLFLLSFLRIRLFYLLHWIQVILCSSKSLLLRFLLTTIAIIQRVYVSSYLPLLFLLQDYPTASLAVKLFMITFITLSFLYGSSITGLIRATKEFIKQEKKRKKSKQRRTPTSVTSSNDP